MKMTTQGIEPSLQVEDDQWCSRLRRISSTMHRSCSANTSICKVDQLSYKNARTHVRTRNHTLTRAHTHLQLPHKLFIAFPDPRFLLQLRAELRAGRVGNDADVVAAVAI